MLHNEFDITVSYSIDVTSMGIPPGKDKSGQVIEPAEGIQYTIESIEINGVEFKGTRISDPYKIVDILRQLAREHADENIESMVN
jgi:hypothetical protein